MPDIMSPEDTALVEAFIATNGVTKLPPGKAKGVGFYQSWSPGAYVDDRDEDKPKKKPSKRGNPNWKKKKNDTSGNDPEEE
jgi:hypothetical protein